MRNRRSQDARGLVVHHNVSLMVCEDPAVFEEIFNELDLAALSVQRIGPRALLVPADELTTLAAALHDRGVFPKIVGTPVHEDASSSSSSSLTGDADDKEGA